MKNIKFIDLFAGLCGTRIGFEQERRVDEVQRNRPNSSKTLNNNTKNLTVVLSSVGYAMLHQPYDKVLFANNISDIDFR